MASPEIPSLARDAFEPYARCWRRKWYREHDGNRWRRRVWRCDGSMIPVESQAGGVVTYQCSRCMTVAELRVAGTRLRRRRVKKDEPAPQADRNLCLFVKVPG